MSEPITVYTQAGEEVITHSPNVTKQLVGAGKLFTSPPAPTIDSDAVKEMLEAFEDESDELEAFEEE